MNKIIPTLGVIIGVGFIIAGCMTSKTSTVTGTSTTNAAGVVTTIYATNTVTTVNQANLDIDALGLQSIVSIAVTVTVQKDPGALQPIKDIQAALTGIINGANTNSVTQILAVAGQNNAALQAEIAPLVTQASAFEQNLIVKYGTQVGGQISLAMAKAALAGIGVGLAGK